MKRLHWLLSGALVVGGLVGSQLLLRTATAQDGLPDISGDWNLKTKEKWYEFESGTKPSTHKESIGFSASLCGSVLYAEFNPSGPIGPLQGVHGNGHFWAFSGDADHPLVMTGHVNKTANKFKGMILNGHAAGCTDTVHSGAVVVE